MSTTTAINHQLSTSNHKLPHNFNERQLLLDHEKVLLLVFRSRVRWRQLLLPGPDQSFGTLAECLVKASEPGEV